MTRLLLSLLLADILVAASVLGPAWRRNSEAREKLEDSRRAGLSEPGRGARDDAAARARAIEDFEALLLTQRDLPGFTDRLRNLATQEDLRAIRIDYDRKAPGKKRPYEALGVKLRVLGEYANLRVLLREIESLPLPLPLVRMQVDPQHAGREMVLSFETLILE